MPRRLDLPGSQRILLEELFQDVRFHSRVAQSLHLASRRFSGRRCNLLSRDPSRTLGRFGVVIRHAHETFHTSGWAVTNCQGPSARPPAPAAPAALERCRAESLRQQETQAELGRNIHGAGRTRLVSWMDITPQQATAANAT
jgi:hypothetical protein